MITGLASVTYRTGDPGTEFPLGGGVVERIMPGAFDRYLRSTGDVVGLFNHNPSLLLGRRSAGTLRLSVDDVGLRYEIDPSATQLSKDVQIMQGRGDLVGSSFSFRVVDGGERYVRDGDKQVREIHDVDLIDVSPVTAPAYPATAEGRGECRMVSSAGSWLVPSSDIMAECRSMVASGLEAVERALEAQRVAIRVRAVEVSE